jgi:hypothetical protein
MAVRALYSVADDFLASHRHHIAPQDWRRLHAALLRHRAASRRGDLTFIALDGEGLDDSDSDSHNDSDMEEQEEEQEDEEEEEDDEEEEEHWDEEDEEDEEEHWDEEEHEDEEHDEEEHWDADALRTFEAEENL